jgi:hypothetical protein
MPSPNATRAHPWAGACHPCQGGPGARSCTVTWPLVLIEEVEEGRGRAGSRISEKREADLIRRIVGRSAVVPDTSNDRQAGKIEALDGARGNGAAHPGLVADHMHAVHGGVETAVAVPELVGPLSDALPSALRNPTREKLASTPGPASVVGRVASGVQSALGSAR